VKKTIVKYGLLLLVLPVLMALNMGCNNAFGPDDQWPVIVSWKHSENFDVTLKIIKPYGIPQLIVPNREIDLTFYVRSYHATQPFTVRVFLKGVEQEVTLYNDNLPGGPAIRNLPITEIAVFDNYVGTYVAGSGNKPQGVAELKFGVIPDFFPVNVSDWVQIDTDDETGAVSIAEITERYIYNFLVVVEDSEGRTDTFCFNVISKLIVSTGDQN